MNLHLIIHNTAYGIDICIVLFLLILVFLKSKRGTAKTMVILMMVSVIALIISHMFGVSVSNSELSRNILMFNLINIFISLFTVHSVFALLDKEKEMKKVIIFLYSLGSAIVIFFIFYPKLFLLTSTPKLYFPNYFVAGPYYWIMLLFFFSLTVYFLFWMRSVYVISDSLQKNRIKFFAVSLLFAYLFGSIDFLLVFNIPVDPLLGFLFVPLFSIPFTYAVLKYELMDVNIVAKRAFVYGLIVAVVGGLVTMVNLTNTMIIRSYPDFPDWFSSLILAIFVTSGVFFIWRKARESDILKYEFINVVTHKFRTPLTSIKWISENIKEVVPPDIKSDVERIQEANSRLVELTNLLVNLSSLDDKSYEYVFSKEDAGLVLDECVNDIKSRSDPKNITVTYIPQKDLFVLVDKLKIKFVLQTLLDNSVNYTPENGKVVVEISEIQSDFSKSKLSISITDSGIGIPKDEAKYIFTKFYRATNGRKADTEGMGIGLYLSRKIIDHHHGRISVQSGGEGKGTTFTIILPLIE